MSRTSLQIRQLCAAADDEGKEVQWIETVWCGMLLRTAKLWLANNGWGINRCGCGWIACSHAPLRLTMRGRTWIEDVSCPAVRSTRGGSIRGDWKGESSRDES